MAAQEISVTIVNHLNIDIAASPDAVWREILDVFVEARKWRETGYAVEPLNDPSTILSGYRMRLERDGGVVDDRICRITECDDTARRLSLFADFLSEPHGLIVYATYHARETAGGTHYTIDCHSQLGIETPASGIKTDVAAAAAEMKTHSDAYLIGYLRRVKASLEGSE